MPGDMRPIDEFSPNQTVYCTCTLCGEVMQYPLGTIQRNVDVLLDNHIMRAHPMSGSEIKDAADVLRSRPGRIDAPHGTKVMTAAARRRALEVNPYATPITPVQVYCMPCGKYIRLDQRREYFAYPYEKHCRENCKHLRTAEIWRDICGPRREAVFFPQSTHEARCAREAGGYNNAGRRWMPKECWENGTVLKRHDVNFDEYIQAEDPQIATGQPKVHSQIGRNRYV
ncbi:hypothetical protein FIBSPDRAFT_1044954 [Athelia psychrophila]|uniref:Uncharacterized protein n=1 Tax=Athelia psychrophila TaxID=1759441 RepID=A0A166IYY8_9AGAM|nr:hypothetical protein FIBSPDRAFT_1044954 [Fibularhizoctonia sp. CBS 109695]